MNVHTNEAYFTEQLERGKRFRNLGILAIVVSFALSITSSSNIWLIYLAYPFLFAGLPLWTYGRSMQRRATQTPRADKTIDAELKGLNNKFTLHHYAKIDGQLVKHLLIMPNGVLVMESSDALGLVECKSGKSGDTWRNRAGWLERFAGVKPPIGNPSRDMAASMAAVRGLLEKMNKPEVPTAALIVFARTSELDAEGCEFAALPVEELRDTVRDIQYELGSEREETRNVSRILTTEDRRRLSAMLTSAIQVPTAKPVPAGR